MHLSIITFGQLNLMWGLSRFCFHLLEKFYLSMSVRANFLPSEKHFLSPEISKSESRFSAFRERKTLKRIYLSLFLACFSNTVRWQQVESTAEMYFCVGQLFLWGKHIVKIQVAWVLLPPEFCRWYHPSTESSIDKRSIIRNIRSLIITTKFQHQKKIKYENIAHLLLTSFWPSWVLIGINPVSISNLWHMRHSVKCKNTSHICDGQTSWTSQQCLLSFLSLVFMLGFSLLMQFSCSLVMFFYTLSYIS